MSYEQYPHTVRGWLESISRNGVSNRPFSNEPSDLINPETYPDPLEIKPERTALAAILSIRAYQIARPLFIAAKPMLQEPSIASIVDQYSSNADQSTALMKKFERLQTKFNTTFAEGIIIDEALINNDLANPKAIEVYNRLRALVDPQFEYLRQTNGDSSMLKRSSVFWDIYAGSTALPANVGAAVSNVYLLHWERDGKIPGIQEVLRKARNSYASFIEPMAVMHKADVQLFSRSSDIARLLKQVGVIYELHEDKIAVNPRTMARIHEYRDQMKAKRSKTARCAFLVNASEVADFLDIPADFEEPLEDAFNLSMDILAA